MNLLFFDTNFIFYSNSRFNNKNIKKIKDAGFDVFTSEIVVLEGKNKNLRDISDLYKKYKSFMDDEKLKLYVNLNDHRQFDEIAVKDESNRRIDEYIAQFFGKNIIGSIENDRIGTILFDRYQYKRPPFINMENSSDKGWKDTLIWVSFLEFCVGKEYDSFYFVSKDKGFINQQENLKEEFFAAVGKTISFVNADSFEELYLSLGITKLEKKTNKQIPENVVEEIISSIEGLVEYDNPYNGFGDTYKANAFTFTEKPSLEDIELFCNELKENEPCFVFMRSIDLSDIAAKHFFLVSVNCLFKHETIKAFLKSWNLVTNDYPSYKTYFLKSLESRFASTVQNAKTIVSPSDLPF